MAVSCDVKESRTMATGFSRSHILFTFSFAAANSVPSFLLTATTASMSAHTTSLASLTTSELRFVLLSARRRGARQRARVGCEMLMLSFAVVLFALARIRCVHSSPSNPSPVVFDCHWKERGSSHHPPLWRWVLWASWVLWYH